MRAGQAGERGQARARSRPASPCSDLHRGHSEAAPGMNTHKVPCKAGGVGLGVRVAGWSLSRRAAGGLTCQRQETQTPHSQEVLQAEVLHLGGRAGRVN